MGACLTSEGTQLLHPFSVKICRFSELLWYYSQYFRIMGSTAPPYPLHWPFPCQRRGLRLSMETWPYQILSFLNETMLVRGSVIQYET